MRKHRFAKHHAAKVDAIQSPGQFAVDPGLHTMGMAGLVQGDIGLHHGRQYPGARLARTRLVGAGLDDIGKGRVKPDLAARVIRKMFEAFAQRAVQLEVLYLQHHARVRTPPQHGLAFAEPGENPL